MQDDISSHLGTINKKSIDSSQDNIEKKVVSLFITKMKVQKKELKKETSYDFNMMFIDEAEINENSKESSQDTKDIEDCKFNQDRDDDSENKSAQDCSSSHSNTSDENSINSSQDTIDIEDRKFMNDEDDDPEERIEKRKLAVEYICQFEDLLSILKSKHFSSAINNITDCRSCCSDSVNGRFIFLLINILKSYHKLTIPEIGWQALLDAEEDDEEEVDAEEDDEEEVDTEEDDEEEVDTEEDDEEEVDAEEDDEEEVDAKEDDEEEVDAEEDDEEEVDAEEDDKLRTKFINLSLHFQAFFNSFIKASCKWSKGGCLNDNELEEYKLKGKDLVIEYISQFENLDSLMKSQHFDMTIQVLTDIKLCSVFDHGPIYIRKFKERFVSMFLHFNYKNVFEELKNYESSKNNEICEKLTEIKRLSSYLSFVSYESTRIFIWKTEIVSFILQVLQNDNLHKIVKHIDDENDIKSSYLEVIKSNVSALGYIICFYNQCKLIFSPINSKVLFEISKTLNFFLDIESYDLLKLIPFALNYDDDNDEETNIQLSKILRDNNYYNNYSRLHEFLHNINSTKDDIKNSRKALNCFTIDQLFRHMNLQLEYDDFKEFIKFGINFIKYSHLVLLEDLKKFNAESDEYQEDIDTILRTSTILKSVIALLNKYSIESTEFCLQFLDEESENGIRVIVDFLNDKEVSSIMLKDQNNFFLNNFFSKENSKNLHYLLFKLSNFAYTYRDKWRDLNLINILSSAADYKQYQSLMIIANLASEEDLKIVSVSKDILEFSIRKLREFLYKIKIIESHECINCDYGNYCSVELQNRRESCKTAESEEIVYTIKIGEWNLVELLQSLHKFAINDDMKCIIYEEVEFKNCLWTIIYKGNEVEKEYAFKLLNQLCFKQEIALDVKSNSKLVDFMKDKNVKYTSQILIKHIEGILWLINKDNRVLLTRYKEIDPKEIVPKKIFISYNNKSKELCKQIKERLELLGYEIWIDYENIHGSAIEAMAKGIESASCVLICMTEKYKQSENCRLEAEYVLQLKKPFVPLIMQKSYKPDGW